MKSFINVMIINQKHTKWPCASVPVERLTESKDLRVGLKVGYFLKFAEVRIARENPHGAMRSNRV